MVSGVLFIVFLYLLYSRLADAPPPAHQTNKAAAVERPAKAAAGTAGEFFFSFDCCVFFHLPDSHLAAYLPNNRQPRCVHPP